MNNFVKNFDESMSNFVRNLKSEPAYVRVMKYSTDGNSSELVTSGATIDAKGYCSKKNSIFRVHRLGIYKNRGGVRADANRELYEANGGLLWFIVVPMKYEDAVAHRNLDYTADKVLLTDTKLAKVA